MSAIDDVILDRDQRNISQLRHHLDDDFSEAAAQLILDHPGHALVLSGFYILAAEASETDGPPGAYFIGKALQQLGYQVTHVTDRYSSSLYEDLSGLGDLVEFPITDVEASKQFANDLLAKIQPSVVISTERCGVTARGQYLNMRGKDISSFNAKLDYLVLNHPATVGIGDGGNEIGMGLLAEHIPSIEGLPKEPTTTPTSRLILSSVSNWGASGLIAALSRLSKRNLLPDPEEEAQVITRMVDNGAVDGFNVQRAYAVDGFPLEENRKTLEQLHALLAAEGISQA